MANPKQPLISKYDETSTQEYGVNVDKPSETEFNPNLSGFEKLLFFLLGFSPVLAWNCVYVSEAYFYRQLGKSVLSELGLFQNLSSLVAQIPLLFFRKQFKYYQGPISSCFVYMTFYCVLLLAVPVDDLRPWEMYLAQGVNGLFTGVSQTQLGNLGGLYGKAGQCGALLFAGNSLGALLPPALQIILLFAPGTGPFTDEQIHHHQRTSAIIIFSVGAIGSVVGIFAINALTCTKNYRILTTEASMACNEDCMTPGTRTDILKERWAKTVVRICQSGIVFTRGLWLFILSISPFIVAMPRGDLWWTKNLATLLIVATATGDFLGRVIANRQSWLIKSLKGLTISVLLRIVFVVLAVVYATVPSFADAAGKANILPFAIYFLMSLTHGYLVVALQTKSQTACGFYPGEDSCPVISQVSWFASQLGLVVGIVFSFAL